MKRILLSFIIILALPNLSLAWKDDWTKADTIREVAWQVIHVIDWGQTLEIARQPDKFYELNPIMGKHPSVGKVNAYMAISAITHAGISYVLPKKYRVYYQWITFSVSSACIINNFNVGLRVKF